MHPTLLVAVLSTALIGSVAIFYTGLVVIVSLLG